MSMRSLWWLAVPVLGYLYWRRRGNNEEETPHREEEGRERYNLQCCRSGDDERGDTEVDEVDNLLIPELDLESVIRRFPNVILESRFPTRDLHGHTAKAAKDVLARFLDDHYQQYGRGNGEKKVRIITGRGSHSVDGRPVLKPITESYLQNNYRRYRWAPHGGCVLVDLSSKINTYDNDKGRRRRLN